MSSHLTSQNRRIILCWTLLPPSAIRMCHGERPSLNKSYETFRNSSTCSHAVIPSRTIVSRRQLHYDLLHLLPTFDFREMKMIKGKLPWHLKLILPNRIRETFEEMARIHSDFTKRDMVLGRIALIRGTPCPKWHVDKVDMRTICTLHGPGTELKLSVENKIKTNQGDIVLMKGAGWDGRYIAQAVLHRSPKQTDENKELVRLIVQTDSVRKDYCDD